MSEAIDTDTITTDAGDYVVSWFYDEDSESPIDGYDTGTAFYVHGGRDLSVYIDTLTAADDAGAAFAHFMSEHYHDGEAVVRRYEKWRAITSSPWQLFTGSGNGSVQGHWWNWYLLIDTNDFTFPEEAALSIMDEYELWAQGEVYSFVIAGPDGVEFEGCGGFIGDDARHAAVEDYVRPLIDHDVEQRQKNASLVGAGFVGLI